MIVPASLPTPMGAIGAATASPTTHAGGGIPPVTTAAGPVLPVETNVSSSIPTGDGTQAAAAAQFGDAPLAAARTALLHEEEGDKPIPATDLRILRRLKDLYVGAGADLFYDPEERIWVCNDLYRSLDGRTYLVCDFKSPNHLITPWGRYQFSGGAMCKAGTTERFWDALQREFDVTVDSRELSLSEIVGREHEDYTRRGELAGPVVRLKERAHPDSEQIPLIAADVPRLTAEAVYLGLESQIRYAPAALLEFVLRCSEDGSGTIQYGAIDLETFAELTGVKLREGANLTEAARIILSLVKIDGVELVLSPLPGDAAGAPIRSEITRDPLTLELLGKLAKKQVENPPAV